MYSSSSVASTWLCQSCYIMSGCQSSLLAGWFLDLMPGELCFLRTQKWTYKLFLHNNYYIFMDHTGLAYTLPFFFLEREKHNLAWSRTCQRLQLSVIFWEIWLKTRCAQSRLKGIYMSQLISCTVSHFYPTEVQRQNSPLFFCLWMKSTTQSKKRLFHYVQIIK